MLAASFIKEIEEPMAVRRPVSLHDNLGDVLHINNSTFARQASKSDAICVTSRFQCSSNFFENFARRISEKNATGIVLVASVRPHNPSDSDRHDRNPMATIRGGIIGCYKNCILTRRLT